MKEDDVFPTNQKKDSSDSVLFGRGRYKFFAFAALMLLAFWSMFTGTVTLRLSTEDLNRLSEDIGIPTNHESLDVLEMEERERVVKHMWDVYTNSRRIKLPQFWQQAFVAAYEELTSDVPGVRDAAIGEIAKMSVARSISLDPTTPSRSMTLKYQCQVSICLTIMTSDSGDWLLQNPTCRISWLVGKSARVLGRSFNKILHKPAAKERQTQNHHLFHLRAQDTPLTLVTADLQPPAQAQPSPIGDDEEDPFEPTGFITAFSTWSLEPNPIFARSSLSFSGHLAELERTLELASNSTNSSSSTVVVDSLRAYMQIVDVASILGLDCDISEHAFELFRDCCSATCLRNRSVEARSQLHPMYSKRRLGKYIKILGEALQLSQPINSNSISVHMPRFCTLLQLNKSAQELATYIGEVVINKCFCTRRNPISIYLSSLPA
ncbi:hypothetical protein YC2023_007057 [Brassica napus]